MRVLTIKRIELTNFKGEKKRTIDFGERETTIAGMNGKGKSRIMDAFCWCLFGKDSKDRKDYEIQTRDENGNVVHHLSTEVVVTMYSAGEPLNTKEPLNTNEANDEMVKETKGKEYVFARKMDENWVKPRGCTEARLKGRETKCSINDIPMTISEYNSRVNEVLNETTFKLLSNPLYFSTVMEWRKRRELLFQTVQMLTDDEIAKQSEDLTQLLERMNGTDMVDYRKMIVQRRNKAKAELDDITPRIDQTEKMKPEERNWVELEENLANVQNEINELTERVSSEKSAIEQVLAEKKNLINEVLELKSKQRAIVDAENAKRKAEMEEPMKKLAELQKQRQDINNDLAETNRNILDLQKKTEGWKNELVEVEVKIAGLRSKFETAKAKNLNEYVCSECGQIIPADKAGAQRNAYLMSLKEQGATLKGLKDSYKGFMDKAEMDLAKENLHFQALSSAKNKLEKEIAEVEERKPEIKAATIYDIEECIELQREIAKREKAIDSTTTEDNEETKKALSEAVSKRDEIQQQLNDRAMIKRCDLEIEMLNVKARELAQMIANYQRDEDAIDKFTRTKVEMCEKAINDKFDEVSFRLFNVTLEGNLEECCEPMVNGALFGAANTAGQINAGIEIINVLSGHYGVTVPVWIDNAESVNKVRETSGQRIMLRVSEDKELTIY